MSHLGFSRTIVVLLLPVVLSLFYIRQVQARRLREPFEDQIFVPHFMDLIKSHGRSGEWHNITTDDGFILTVFRILSNPSACQRVDEKRVLFLQHGLDGAADFFNMYGPSRSLAYTLSDAGYDVWLGNFRGSAYSKNHQYLLPDDGRLWNFSLDEQGLLDLPAMIDYVLNSTGQTSLTYVAHSSGCTAALMLLSDKPDYNKKINLNVMLAPIVFWRYSDRIVQLYALPFRVAVKVIPSGAVPLIPRTIILKAIFNMGCFRNVRTFRVCFSLVDLISGRDHEQLNQEIITRFLDYYPAGSSMKIFYHFVQHIDSGKFRHYDYNPAENLRYYGRVDPPEYNLKKITTPSVILRGPNDPLSSKGDVELLISELVNSPMIYETIGYEKFNHIDFIIAKDAKRLLFDPLLRILGQIHGDQCHMQ